MPLKVTYNVLCSLVLKFSVKKVQSKSKNRKKNPIKSIRTSDYVTSLCLRKKCKEIYEPKEINADGFFCCGLETKPWMWFVYVVIYLAPLKEQHHQKIACIISKQERSPSSYKMSVHILRVLIFDVFVDRHWAK